MLANRRQFQELTNKPAVRKPSEHEKMARAIAAAMPKTEKGEAPKVTVNVPPQHVVVENLAPPFPEKLVFNIIRDREGRMKQVVLELP